MDRRRFLKGAMGGALAVGAVAKGFTTAASGADGWYPSGVNESLFQAINRAKNPANKTPLEKSHAPAITAPERVKAGEPFTVEVSVGETLHPMGPSHWIEYIELNIANEPAGMMELRSRGYLKPRAVFTVVIAQEQAAGGKIALIARQRCNIHGLWETGKALEVTS